MKTAVRELAAPIDSMAAFTSIIDDILTNNPWGCTSYEQAGVTLPGVSKASESYTGRVIYENNEAKTSGQSASRLRHHQLITNVSIFAPWIPQWGHSIPWKLRGPVQLHPQVSSLQRRALLGPLCPWFRHPLILWGWCYPDQVWPGLKPDRCTRITKHNTHFFPFPRYGNELVLRNILPPLIALIS